MNQNNKNMRELVDELNRLTVLYDAGKPEITDGEWDILYLNLKDREKETGIIYPDSPTQKIHFETVSELKKVPHTFRPMLSLDKSKEVKDIENFVKGHEWFGMFKMDGLSCRLTYDAEGNLIAAATRGNGEVGEDITHNMTINPTVPKKIPATGDTVIIDGEIICDYLTFNKYFSNEYKNPRNFAAGAIRRLNSAETAQAQLTFVAWELVKGSDIDYNFWRLEQLDDWGFITVPRVGDAETIEDAIAILNNMRDGAGSYENSVYHTYPLDGYVFKFESKSYGDGLGRTDHHWKNTIAYKFYDEEYETQLRDIEWSMGRTGQITPIALFEKINIDGTEISRASLSNLSILKKTLGEKPFKGQTIMVTKRNQIIPKIERAKDEKGQWI